VVEELNQVRDPEPIVTGNHFKFFNKEYLRAPKKEEVAIF
jgi:hypothetical protein